MLNRYIVIYKNLPFIDKYIIFSTMTGGPIGFIGGIWTGFKEERHSDIMRTTITSTFYGCIGGLCGITTVATLPLLVPIGIGSYLSKKCFI
jgi:hypothetical protein